MKYVVLVLLVLTSASANAADDKDFDLACAVTSAAEVGSNPQDSEVGRMAFLINTFFLGRLSGRDPNFYWAAIVSGKLAGLKEGARSAAMFSSCIDFFVKQR